eukprot:5196565-Pyramimonas_sp.AAC.1
MISSKSDIPSPSVSGEMGLVKCLVTSSKSERPSPSLPDNIASSEHSYALTQGMRISSSNIATFQQSLWYNYNYCSYTYSRVLA